MTGHGHLILSKSRVPLYKKYRVYLFVEGRGSRVPCRGSRVEGRGSEGRGSRVEGRGSRVEGRRVEGRGLYFTNVFATARKIIDVVCLL